MRYVLAILLVLVLSACNGGGDSSNKTSQTGGAGYTVGGTISGLVGSGLVLANGSESLTVAAQATSFTFLTGLAQAATYSVSISAQPAGQTCTLSGGSGTIAAANVTSVKLTCVSMYSLTGTITGLNSNGLILANGTESLTIADSASTFSFNTQIAQGASYAVTVTGMPFWQKCTVSNGTGTIASANVTNVLVSCVAATATVKTVAGSTVGYLDNATGTKAQFSTPQGLAIDSLGNLYIADKGNNVIRMMTPAGAVTTFAGSGNPTFGDGTSITANFNGPTGLAIDSSNNLYVADTGNNQIRKITTTGQVVTLAGSGSAGYTDALGLGASFNGPTGVTVDSSGNVYVLDSGNGLIRLINSSGLVTTIAGVQGVDAGTGAYVNGTGSAAEFCMLENATITPQGTVYFTDLGAGAVRQITSTGVVSTFVGISANSGSACNGGVTNTIDFTGIATDSQGTLFVTSPFPTDNQILKITPGGLMTNLAGLGAAGSKDGGVNLATFSGPAGIAVDSSGNVYVSDATTALIRKISHN